LPLVDERGDDEKIRWADTRYGSVGSFDATSRRFFK